MVTRSLRGERGSALIWVLGFIVTLGIVISASQVLARMAERQMFARNSVSQTELAAASAVDLMTDQVRGIVGERLGNLAQQNFLPINIRTFSLAHDLNTTGATVQSDTLLTGVRIVDVREGEVIPHDEKILGVWTHQPRVSYDAIPDVGGSTALRTFEIEVSAAAHGPREGKRMVTRRLAVSVIAPHQHALYTEGDAEVKAGGPGGLIGGPVRVDGTAYFEDGDYLMKYVGGIEARDGISVAGSDHVIGGNTYTTTSPLLSSLSRVASEANPASMLAPWQGRVRIRPAVGGSFSPGRMQSSSIAGTGECRDFAAACFGRSSFRPALTLQRLTAGPGGEFSVGCGVAYDDAGGLIPCYRDAAAPAMYYRPWPFLPSDPVVPGSAAPDPLRPGRIWQGFFPDFRREAACDGSAFAGGQPYRTFRCPTNAYGFELVGDSIPPIPGGMIVVRRERLPNRVGAQEIVLIRKATLLQAPLTLVSEVPVVIVGNFNTNNPKPAMIYAPRITVMPNETMDHLRTSMAWDDLGPAMPVLPVQARSNVTLYAVLRTGYCRTIGGAYFGGSWEGMPAAYGDWSRGALRVAGAVEGYDQSSGGAAACAAYWAPMNGPQPGGVRSRPPFQRSVLFNRRLLHPAGQPPGSWHPDNYDLLNTPAPGAPTRTRARQSNAIGGITVLRQLQDLRTIPPAARGSELRPTGRTVPGAIPLSGVPPALF